MGLFGTKNNRGRTEKPQPPKPYFSGRELREAARRAPSIFPGTRKPTTERERLKELEEFLGPRALTFGGRREDYQRKMRELEKSVWSAKTPQEKQNIQEKIQRLKHYPKELYGWD